MFFQSLTLAVFFILLAYGGARWIGKKSTLPLPWKINGKTIFEGVTLGLKVFLLVLLLGALTSLLFPVAPHLIENIFKDFVFRPYQIVLIALAIVVIAPVAEEIFFRGFLLPTLQIRWGTRWALHLTSFFFALLHLDPLRFLPLYGASYLIGRAALQQGSLMVAVLAHGVWNFSSLTLMWWLMKGGAF
ncbi:CPBP family intramembrane glutamic endopeptidase [Heliorestis convoluta]|nr:type II CAAX endopeptidase family protein [Heliorestis convoluta]